MFTLNGGMGRSPSDWHDVALAANGTRAASFARNHTDYENRRDLVEWGEWVEPGAENNSIK